MKQCSYCGAEYPDDAIECAIDKTPFLAIQREPPRLERRKVAILSEHQIPVSLAIVSYLFFLPSAFYLASIIFSAPLIGVFAGTVKSGGEITSAALVCGAFGVVITSLILRYAILLFLFVAISTIWLVACFGSSYGSYHVIFSGLFSGTLGILLIFLSQLSHRFEG